MEIFDRSVLALPFFSEHHRALAERFESWTQCNGPTLDTLGTADVKGAVRSITRALGEGGWLGFRADGTAPAPVAPPLDLRSICLLREGLCFVDDLLDFAFSIQGLAAAPLIMFANEEQQNRYLPELCSGRKLGSLALSEADAGSNLAATQLSAVRDAANYVLNGEKTWIANGNVADFHCVLARTGEGPGAFGLSLCLVPADTPGVSVAADLNVMAPRPLASLKFENCVVPRDNLIGRAGSGFQYALTILNRYRTTVGAAALGFCRRALQAALERTKSRKVFGALLFDQQMTKQKLADMAVFLDAASLLVVRSAWELDCGGERSDHSSMAKLYASEGAQKLVDDALQLFGAAGTLKNSLLERLYRQVRLLRIYEGTSEIQKLIIADSLVAGGCAVRRSS